MDPQSSARGLTALALLRSRVPVDSRRATVRQLSSRCRFPPLAVLFAAEPSSVAAALFDTLQLAEADWMTILPDIGPLARSRLRQRADLPPSVVHGLRNFGSTDFALSQPSSVYVETVDDLVVADAFAAKAEGGSDIAQLVQRIESWRQRKPASNADAHSEHSATKDTTDPQDTIAFVTDLDGLVRSVRGAPRAAFVGISLARAAEPGEAGVDAGVARAFSKRGPIRHGRIALAAGNPWAGLWTILADPCFDSATGRFTGYRGSLTLAGEAIAQPTPAVQPHHPDTVKQMLHELRSPLTAISGFAQLIAGQYFGPVPALYQTLNSAILRDAERLNAGIEDLALAAELDSGGHRIEPGETVLRDALAVFADRHGGIAPDDLSTDLAVSIGSKDLAALLDRSRRALDPEESVPFDIDIVADLAAHRLQIIFSLIAPLSSSGSDPARDAARTLARRLAEAHGGELIVQPGSASLNLPLVTVMAQAANRH